MITNASEIGIAGIEVTVVCVHIPRNPISGYHFVTGYGWETETTNLFIYFDGSISTDVPLYVVIVYSRIS